jgi:hypothetical protein
MHRTLPLLKNVIDRTTPLFKNKTSPIVKKFVITKTLHLKPGKVRYPFHIAYGGIDEGPYKKDSVVYTPYTTNR